MKKYLNVDSQIIYNPIKTRKFENKKIFKKKLKIITVGRLTEQKNQLFLLKTLTKLNNKFRWTLKIVGRGILEKKIRLFIKENSLSEKVKLSGYKKCN